MLATAARSAAQGSATANELAVSTRDNLVRLAELVVPNNTPVQPGE